MSHPETPTEPTSAATEPPAAMIPTQAAPVESTLAYSAPDAQTYAAPAETPTYAAPTYAAPTYAASTYAAPAETPTYAAPAQAYQAGDPKAQVYPAGYPAYDAQASAVPASGMPASGVPASGMPASGVPASGVPGGAYGYAPGYAPAGAPQAGYAPAGYAPAGYAPAGYPTASYPAGVPAEPKKSRPKSTIVFAALTAMFVLVAAGMTVLYLGKNSDASKSAKQVASSSSTITAQKGQLDSLKQQLQTAQDGADSAKQTSDGQINDLKHTNGLLITCVTDVNTVIDLENASLSTFNKDWEKMVKACLVAKAESN